MPAHALGTAFDNGARGRFNAAFFDTMDRFNNRISQRHKQHAFDGLEETDIVEIGAGVGANFVYYPAGAAVTAIEPNLAMHPRLESRAEAHGITLDIVASSASSLPFPDASVDTVVCTLVLCTVESPAAVLAEVQRVLKPGGTFRFVEHVAAPPWSPRAWLQRTVRRPWSWLFEGCDPYRPTTEVIRAAGFRHLDLAQRRFRSPFLPVNTAISGTATK